MTPSCSTHLQSVAPPARSHPRQDLDAAYEAALERRRKEVEAERLAREHEQARLFGASNATQHAHAQAQQQQQQAANTAGR